MNYEECLMHETVWYDKYKYDAAEKLFEEAQLQQQQAAKMQHDGNMVQQEAAEMQHNETMQEQLSPNESQQEEKIPHQLPPTQNNHQEEEISSSARNDCCSVTDEIAAIRRRIRAAMDGIPEHNDGQLNNRRDDPNETVYGELEGAQDDIQGGGDHIFYCGDDRSNYNVNQRYANLWAQQDKLNNTVQGIECKVAMLSGAVDRMSHSLESLAGKVENFFRTMNIEVLSSDEDDEKLLQGDEWQKTAAQNATKPAVSGQLHIVLEVNPVDYNIDLKALEMKITEIETDGLTWVAAEIVPVPFGISKLRIAVIVEDEIISVNGLKETIESIECMVQSVDIVSVIKL